jgi:hypothetical protein
MFCGGRMPVGGILPVRGYSGQNYGLNSNTQNIFSEKCGAEEEK